MNWEAIGAVGELLSAAAVLATLVYLALQVRHSNRIAFRDSRSSLVASYSEAARIFLENPELAALRVKLRDEKSVLSELEQEQARLLVDHQFSFWSEVNVSASTGLLPAANENVYFERARNLVRTYPGLTPYFENWFIDGGIKQGDFRGIYNIVWQEIEKLR